MGDDGLVDGPMSRRATMMMIVEQLFERDGVERGVVFKHI